MKLKTRSVTILTDDEVALVSGGILTIYTRECGPTEAAGGCGFEETWPNCNTATYPTDTLECGVSRECDPNETYYCSNVVCLDTAGQCDTTACG